MQQSQMALIIFTYNIHIRYCIDGSFIQIISFYNRLFLPSDSMSQKSKRRTTKGRN